MRSCWPILALAVALSGCGFRRVLPAGDGTGDVGAGDADAGASADLAGGATTDLATAADDLAGSDGGVATGAGPLGALPAGFCCHADGDCRARNCMNDGPGPRFCVEDCTQTADCSAYGPGFFCDPTFMRCRPKLAFYACLDPSTYAYGTRPDGACCDGDATHPGQECAGGWCIHTGATSNPSYCESGCKIDDDCPTGEMCGTAGHCQRVDVVNSCTQS